MMKKKRLRKNYKKTLTLFYVTFPNSKTAQKIARETVERKLSICAHVLPAGISYFQWNGKTQQDKECIAFFKVTSRTKAKLQTFLQKTHPYEVPCILEIPVASANALFLSWANEAG